jgi:hypothetical protein
MISEGKNTKETLLNAERIDQIAEAAYLVEVAKTATEKDEESSQSDSEKVENSLAIMKLGDDPDSIVEMTENVDFYMSRQLQVYSKASTLEIALISDDHFLQIAEHIRLQKLVNNLALSVLNSEPGSASSEPGDVPQQSQFRPRPKREQGSEDPDLPDSDRRTNTSRSATDATAGRRSLPEHPEHGGGGSFEFSDNPMPTSQQTSASPRSFQEAPFQREPYPGTPNQAPYQGQPPYFGYNGRDDNFPFAQNVNIPRTFPAPPYNPTSSNTVQEHGWNYSPTSPPSKEMLEMREKLARYEMEQAIKKEAAMKKEIEERVRIDAEASFARRMEDIRKAQDEAKIQIEQAAQNASEAARIKMADERRANEEKKKVHEEAMKRAEREAREKLEAELSEKRRRGLRKYLPVLK